MCSLISVNDLLEKEKTVILKNGAEFSCVDILDVLSAPAVSFGDERLEPKKPYVVGLSKIIECPNCKRRLRTTLTLKNPENYCPRCGQAIDWSEVEE